MGVKDDICNYDYFFGHKWLFGTLCRKEKEKIQEHYLHEKHQKKWDDKYQPVAVSYTHLDVYKRQIFLPL